MTTADAIFIFGLLFVSVALMGIGFMFRRQGFVFGAVGFWMLLAGYGFVLSAATWDIYYTLGWFGVGMVLVSAIEAMVVREKPEPPEERDSLDDFMDKQEQYNRKVNKMEEAMRSTRRRGRRRYEE
jgi:hypothetical protein